MPLSREILRRLPKAELHCHLDGSVRPETMLDLAREEGKPMPAADAESLRSFMKVDDARHLEDYLERFAFTLSVIQTEPALERIAYELAEDARQDGVRYIEVRYAPILNVEEGLTLEQAVEAPLRGLARAERDHGIVGRVIVCAIRNMPATISRELAELAVAFRHHGVVGFDLAGGEAGNPASVHAASFEYARSNDLACTCHAGEGDGADSVREALYVCGAHRIGHATRLIEDASLTDYCNDWRVPLEICLTSNVQTRAASSYATHPFREYFRRGLNVVLNTDNRLMSGVTLTDEYVHAATEVGMTFDELSRVALNGFESAFIHRDDRLRLIADAELEIAALKRSLPMSERQAYGTAAARTAADAIRRRIGHIHPVAAVILGSGLGGLAQRIAEPRTVPFRDVPGFPSATVVGHSGTLIAGSLAGREVIALAGRFHMYEGHDAALAGFPVRVLHALGVPTLFVSNAAGGIRRTFRAGDLMLIRDHINLMFRNPLTGAVEEGDERFPDMSAPYDEGLSQMLREHAIALGIPLQEGVYGALLGPAYETPAEVRMLSVLGADAVGMSTVPEVIVARAMGMRVAGVSCVTNLAAGLSPHPLSHAEVLETTRVVGQRFESLVERFVGGL